MTPGPDANTEVIIEIDNEEYAFQVNGKETVRLGYNYENNTIISDEIPIVKDRDSIEVVKITNDTLILNLKEKGQSHKRTFTRIK
jgi:hypothetical protein